MRPLHLAWLVAAVLLIQPVAASAAHTAVADGQDTGSASTAFLSPEAAASQKAAVSGSPVEVTDDRTEYTTTYANPDGTTFTVDQSTVPVRVHQGDGSWVSPDPTLEVRSDGTVGPKAALVDLAFSSGGDGSGLVDIARGGKSLRLGWPGALPKPTLDGASAVYTDVLPGVDLRMTATAEGFRELLVVKSPQAAADPELKKVAFSLQADGLTVAPTSGGGMTAVDDDARPVFAAPAALMWDSQGDTAASGASAQLERTAAITQASSPSPSATTDPSAGTSADGTAGPGDGDASAVLPVQVSTDSLAVVPDAGMLANSDSNAYPLYIDPSVGLDQTAHTYLRSDGVSDFNWGNGSNNEGKGTGHCSSWNGYYCGPGYTERLYFQFSPSSLAGKKVLSATFRATESWSFTCDARWVDLERTSNISSSTTWSTRPSYLGMMASRDVSAGRSSLCDPSQPPAPIEFSDSSLTSAVGDLAAGKFSRLTLLLKARDETDTSAWKRFRNDAVLSVTYVGLPAVPTRAGIVEGSGISCETNSGDPDTITDPTPSLTAAVWTATGGGSGASLRAHFYIQKQTTDGWSVATEPVRPTSGYVGNGGVVTYPSPITLSEGVLYRLAVFSRSYYNGGDDYLESHSTVTTKDWCYFKVDTTAPKAPAVSFGQPYSECTANLCDPAGGPGTPGQFTFSPASGDTNTAYEYKLASSASWSKPISGNKVNVAITPQVAGSQQLQVRAQDSAGRWGAKAIVKFNVAAGQTAIGRWHFDDAAPGSGATTAADTATEGSTRHPATLYTSGTGWSSLARRGDSDRSLWLNDTSDTTRQAGYAATAAPVVNTQSSFTVSAWAYLTDESDFRTVLSETGSDGSGFSLYYSPNVQRWVFLWNWYENGVRKYLGASADTAGVPMKVWTHLTGVYNSKDRTISLYVNGRLQGSPVALPATSDATISDGTLQFGRASFTPGSYVNYWRGRIDEVAVWQRNLTEQEDGIATEDQLLDSNGVPSVELMGAWNPDGASGTTLADTTSGYGRTLTLSGGASLDGQALVLNGTDGAATAPGPLLDDTASFTATSLVDIDSSALLSKPTGYTAQVLGQRSADGSAWGFWYQLTGTDTDPETDTTIPVGKWYFGRLNTDGSFDGVVSDEAAELGSPVRMTGTYDAPSGTIHFYLGPDENGAEATHPYTAVAGSGVFAAGEGYVGGSWGHYLPGKITDIRIWAGAMANQQITDTIGD